MTLQELSGLTVTVVVPGKGSFSQAFIGKLDRITFPSNKPDIYCMGTANSSIMFCLSDVDAIEVPPDNYNDCRAVIRLRA